jgi:hypothetical protein
MVLCMMIAPKHPYTVAHMDGLMPGKDRDEESGEYVTTYSDERFLQAVDTLGPDVGTQAIADEVGCDRDTAYRRLRALEADGELESRKVGMARLWSLSDSE